MAAQMTRQKTSSLMGRIADFIDRIVPPQTRREFFRNCSILADERPYFAAFLAVQIALSALPFLLFVGFALATIVLAAVAALAFCVFWIGAALLVFIPTLFTAIFAGIFIWIWAVGTYIFCNFTYRNIYPQVEQRMPDRSTMRSLKSSMEQSASRGAQSFSNGAQSLSNGANSITNRAKSFANGDVAAGVPEVVKNSINQAHESPEAAANREAVEEKKAVEAELLDELEPEDSSGRQGFSNGSVNETEETSKTYASIDDYQPPSVRRFAPGEIKF